MSVFCASRLSPVVMLLLFVVVAGCGEQTPSPEAQPYLEENSAADATTSDQAVSNEVDDEAVRILFLGDSITAGYGIDQSDAFPARVEMRLKDAGYRVNAIDAGVSGDTSTGGLNRLDWLLQNRVDILVLELGGNDGLRGIDLSLTRANLGAIIEETRVTWPGVQVVLVGMRVPPNLGQEYTEDFASIYPDVAEAYDTYFVPFLADGFEDIVHLLQNDGIHPTVEGHALIADKVSSVVEPIVAEMEDAS